MSECSNSNLDDEIDSNADYASRRIAIYWCYANAIHWTDRSQLTESAKIIRESLQIPENIMKLTCLYPLFEQFEEIKRCSEECTGKKVINDKVDKRMIGLNSEEAQVMANGYEDGFFHRATTDVVNDCLLEKKYSLRNLQPS